MLSLQLARDTMHGHRETACLVRSRPYNPLVPWSFPFFVIHSRVPSMKRITGLQVIPLLIAVSCVSLLMFLQWLRPSLIVPLDIAAGDYLFLREDGPHLGSRPVRDDIVLVLIDTQAG